MKQASERWRWSPQQPWCWALGAGRVATKDWPRFTVAALHRNLALISLVFLVLHIGSAVIDGYVALSWIDVVIPFFAVIFRATTSHPDTQARPWHRHNRLTHTTPAFEWGYPVVADRPVSLAEARRIAAACPALALRATGPAQK